MYQNIFWSSKQDTYVVNTWDLAAAHCTSRHTWVLMVAHLVCRGTPVTQRRGRWAWNLSKAQIRPSAPIWNSYCCRPIELSTWGRIPVLVTSGHELLCFCCFPFYWYCHNRLECLGQSVTNSESRIRQRNQSRHAAKYSVTVLKGQNHGRSSKPPAFIKWAKPTHIRMLLFHTRKKN
jgi:hypothetical protein